MVLNSVHLGERVLITGFTGSLGTRLIEVLSQQDVRIRGISRDEAKQLAIRQRFPHVQCVLGDVRDTAAVRAAVRGCDVVIHAASLKQVDISEQQPREYALTNVLGTINVIDTVLAERTVRRCVGVSSDKCCRPINTYGLTKSLLEKLFHEAAHRPENETIFTVARYGNVIGSRGSVLPIWQQQRLQQPLRITDPTMTRFLFSMDEAVALLNRALQVPSGVIVSKRMSAALLSDIAQIMQTQGIHVIGRRPGEKLHEELLTAEEMSRTETTADDFFLYDPARPPVPALYNYTSEVAPRLTGDVLAVLLKEYME